MATTAGTQRRIEIERNGTRWTFSVDTDYNAELVEVYDDGPAAHADIPQWVETVLDKIGIEGVEA